MPISVVRGTTPKPAASTALEELLSGAIDYRGELFIGYPILPTPEGAFSMDALLVSPDKGLVVLDLVEGREVEDYAERQDFAANALEARLKTYRQLVTGRTLRIPIATLTYAPAGSEVAAEDEHALVNSANLLAALDRLEWSTPDDDVYQAAISAIQSLATIRRARIKRQIAREDSRGAKLQKLEDSIATLDTLQSRAVVETVEGVQRIRGLAGSGKTIVLALKAAYLHVQHPEWRIAVTFNTRSLKGQFRRLINTFVVEQTGDEPDWDNLRVVNAWGAPGGEARDGIYHEFCNSHGVRYYDFSSARAQFGPGDEFGEVCSAALAEVPQSKTLYNAILIDEAQDFPVAFLNLCYRILGESKRLVYAYDELQNLAGLSLPPPEELFGRRADGVPNVVLRGDEVGDGREDIVLQRCYRNSRPVLVTAHSLGFGIYREPPAGRTTGLVQMFDHPPLWEDIGYRVEGGSLQPGHRVVLERTEETSPRFLEDHSAIEDLVSFHRFDSEDEQTAWLVEAIRKNLQHDELRHDDIVVINPDPVTTRKKVGSVRAKLLELGINSHLAGVDTDPDVFFNPDYPSITFTGIFRAKGNEAGMVYVMNSDAGQTSQYNLATVRNRVFTAITRSKAWVRVLGVGAGMDLLMREYACLNERNFALDFRYPTDEERTQLQIVHRDMTAAQRKRAEERARSLSDTIAAIEAGEMELEDLPIELRERLGAILGSADDRATPDP